jgi:uncharacterized protein
MRVALIADIHDNIWALAGVLARVNDCDVLLCLGDLCSPFTLAAIGEQFAKPIHVVWGNNDGDKLLIAQSAAKAKHVTLHGEFAELQIGGRSIAMTHYPVIAKAVAASHAYDVVCYGHNHKRDITWIGKTCLLNPGEVMGRFGVRSCAVYNTERGDAQIIEV